MNAWAPALVHRHRTYSRPRRLAKLIHSLQSRLARRTQSPHATSCPQICRTRL